MSDPATTAKFSTVRRDRAVPEEGNSLLVVLRGPEVGRIVPLFRDETTIGRAKDAVVCLADAKVSRQHAVVRRIAESFDIIDLGSTNGTWVNSEKCDHAVLKDQDRIEIGVSVVKFVAGNSAEQPYYQEAYRQAYMDTVLLVYNKRYFLQRLDEELCRCRRKSCGLSLLLFDADRFKHLNDTYGHLAGDAALVHLVSRIKSRTRRMDALCRYGGDEFALLLPDTAQAQAFIIAESIRSLIAQMPLEFGDRRIAITVSIGVVGFTPGASERGGDAEELIAAADRALYLAKQRGRNQTVGANELESP